MSTTTAQRSARLLPSTSHPPQPASAGTPRPTSRRRRLGTRVAVALVAGGLVATAGHALAASNDGPPALGPGVVTVEVGIQHSHFDLGDLRVQQGTLVQFVVHNGDPIDHELVVGDAEVHQRHAAGSERRHPPVPGEVSVAPGDTAMTFYEFTEPGTIVYACHLPGHIAYGMTGEIEVVPAG
jgi:uncharacterized cupredoxin-like copper-binding protein